MPSNDLAAARALVDNSSSVVIVTGAGVSTASGIPDFRGPDGLWTKDPASESASHIDSYLGSEELRRAAWTRLLNSRTTPIRPNPAHFAIAEFEARDRLTMLVTQNTDGLHLTAGNTSEHVVEIHGHMRAVRCLRCGHESTTDQVIDRIIFNDLDPHCREVINGVLCDGVLKTAVVSFGQSLDPVEYHRAERAILGADLLICTGSTLSVYPVADLVSSAVHTGVRLVILNDSPTGFDARAAVVITGDLTVTLPALLAP